jgi:hypothetical protein
MSDKISKFDLKMLKIYPFLLGAISYDYLRTYLYIYTVCLHLNNPCINPIKDTPRNNFLYILEKSKNFLYGGFLGMFTANLIKKMLDKND